VVPLQIPRLRRWLAAFAIILICVVVAFYLNARHRVQNALKQVPEKIGIEVQQSAKGFTISKSFQGRTLFKIEASKAIQLKAGGRSELHGVEITVYGRDSSRFDRIKGKDFEYDVSSGDVIGKGEVEIDLESNPAGDKMPDQSVPKELSSPLQIRTTDLIFNQKSGDARADGEVDFSLPQASGSAIGMNYVAQSSVLTLNSQVQIKVAGITPVTLSANRLTISRGSRTLVLAHPNVTDGVETMKADGATVYFSSENKLDRVLAEGNVSIASDRAGGGKITAQQLELVARDDNSLRQATFSRDVLFDTALQNGIHGTAGRATLHFGPKDILQTVHTESGTTLSESRNSDANSTQNFELSAPAMDFYIKSGRLIQRAETQGPPTIILSSSNTGSNGSTDTTTITAGRFEANFDGGGQIASVHGAPDARIVSKSQDRGKKDRISTSQIIDAGFNPGHEITSVVQEGSFAYDDGEIKAWADTARYKPQDQTLVLEGSPRVENGGMTTSAQTIRINRATGNAYAEGDVKTSDTALQSKAAKPADPLHITADSMVVDQKSDSAEYKGNVRAWQGVNSVTAPLMEFRRGLRTVTAERNGEQRVSAKLSQAGKNGKITPVNVVADRLVYSEEKRILYFGGDAQATSGDIGLSAAEINCFFIESYQTNDKKAVGLGSNLNKVVASGSVIVTEPGRRATGSHLAYTAADDKFVMTGGPPSIFDAEHGNVTGVSLTLYGHDGRVLVEGTDKSPAVTETRVAR
jgi:lipopolysaccharide export system protein LptA